MISWGLYHTLEAKGTWIRPLVHSSSFCVLRNDQAGIQSTPQPPQKAIFSDDVDAVYPSLTLTSLSAVPGAYSPLRRSLASLGLALQLIHTAHSTLVLLGGGRRTRVHTYPLILIIIVVTSMPLNRACISRTHQPQGLQKITLPWLTGGNVSTRERHTHRHRDRDRWTHERWTEEEHEKDRRQGGKKHGVTKTKGALHSDLCFSPKQLWSQVPSSPIEFNGTNDHS